MQNMTNPTQRDPERMEIARMIARQFIAFLDEDLTAQPEAELLLDAFQEIAGYERDKPLAKMFLIFAGGVSAGMDIIEALEQKDASARLREEARERRRLELREKWSANIDIAFRKTARGECKVRPAKMAHALGVTPQTVRNHVKANDNPDYFFCEGYVYSCDRI